jgi:nucleotide-binding universal stress UspA family protein
MQIERLGEGQLGMIQQIVCAVRGGPESQETVDSATDLALRAEARLTFFHVIDLACLDCDDTASSAAAYRKCVKKAKSAMRNLCAQARQRGVAHVDFVLWQGDTRQELRQFALETDAELMVLGHPSLDSEHNVFGQDEFHEFLAELDFGGKLRTIQVRLPPDDEG